MPINRIVAFLGPYIAAISGAVADWLFVHLHFLSLFHTEETQVAAAITQVAVFGIVALLTWLGHQKWLEGHQRYETALLHAGDYHYTPQPEPSTFVGDAKLGPARK